MSDPRHYEITNPGGTTTEHELHQDDKATSFRAVFNGRSSGVITIRIKTLGSDGFEAPDNNTIDLASKKTWLLHNCPIEAIELADAGVGAYGVVLAQWRP